MTCTHHPFDENRLDSRCDGTIARVLQSRQASRPSNVARCAAPRGLWRTSLLPPCPVLRPVYLSVSMVQYSTSEATAVGAAIQSTLRNLDGVNQLAPQRIRPPVRLVSRGKYSPSLMRTMVGLNAIRSVQQFAIAFSCFGVSKLSTVGDC